METTNSKREYIDSWNSYISSLYLLKFTTSDKLSKEVVATLDKLKELVVEIAEDKEELK